ncbi:MAG: hypothetical protein C5B54_05485, partial [Acidobacteria bacterium]
MRRWMLVPLLLLLSTCTRHTSQSNIPELLSHRSLGLAYLEEGQWKEAEAEFKKIIELAPDEALGYADLALTYLRSGNTQEADNQIQKALQQSTTPEIQLIHAEILDRKGDINDAIDELEKSVAKNPWHVQSQFKLVQLGRRTSPIDRLKIETHLQQIVDNTPANLPARLELVETLLRDNKLLPATAQLLEIQKQVPELPDDASSYLQNALTLLQQSKTSEALTAAIAFHNILKPTPLYRQGIVDLTGSGGSAIGFPVVSFSTKLSAAASARPLQNIKFQETTNVLVDGTSVIFGPDSLAFVCGPDLLMKNEKGHFVPAGFHSEDKAKAARFADYNNDGKPDLLIIGENQDVLYENMGGSFKKVQQFPGPHNGALIVDLDNDGDLDIFLYGEKGNAAYRNNGDGTFTEVTAKMQLSGSSTHTGFGDFDEDGDLDLISGNKLLTNLRQGRFQDISTGSGLPHNQTGSLAIGDIDNDGFLDVFMDGIYRNDGKGHFQKGSLSISASDAMFFDFDNDGYLDLITAGDKPHLYRNKGGGNFEDASSLLPQSLTNIRTIAVNDFDSDGDLDLFLTDSSGKMHVLRNEGGNANRWLNVALTALTTGSGKNNINGIGAKVEVKAGELYQMRVVTDPVTHFGLGSHDAADVLRVVWTNGVPQNHFHPQTNQTIVEKQVLKGSCAFLYTWDGEKYRFVTDVLWKSALGMPLGIMQENTTYAFSASTDEYLKIPGSAVKPKDGFYTMQMTEELWETPYLDKIRFVAVDHPSSSEIYVDEKFVVPPHPPFRIYTASNKLFPISAQDENGNDVLPLIRKQDDEYISALMPVKYQGVMQMHDLILDLGKRPITDHILLYMIGWLYPTDASINMAMTQSDSLRVTMPDLQVIDKTGEWKTAIPNISFPMGKDKMMIVDLKNQFPTQDHRIRIRTNMEIYWDQIFFTSNEPSVSVKTTTLEPISADLHYRGFSKMFRKNLLGPPWVDYSEVDKNPKWRDLVGNYTRYGDVLPLLKESDDMYVIFNSGDEITLRFDANQVPPLQPGWTRDFLIYCDGWLKDGDLNTAYGKTVELLPFHAMKSYPYGKDQSYPQDPAHQEYQKTYNTRKIT